LALQTTESANLEVELQGWGGNLWVHASHRYTAVDNHRSVAACRARVQFKESILAIGVVDISSTVAKIQRVYEAKRDIDRA